LRGEITQDDAVRETQAATRQYAKRQMTWFRRETGVAWFAGFGDDPDIRRQIFHWLGPMLERNDADTTEALERARSRLTHSEGGS
jgi:tRNA dimethylallyltransferase